MIAIIIITMKLYRLCKVGQPENQVAQPENP